MSDEKLPHPEPRPRTAGTANPRAVGAPTGNFKAAGPLNLVGVRLFAYGRTMEMDAGDLRLDLGERVVIDDRRGGSPVATVVVPSGRRAPRGNVGRVLRRAEARDLERLAEEQKRTSDALAFARERARARKLGIKFFRVDLGVDKTTFMFSSEQRVDFRELVRDFAARFHNRIELRQVGVRDEAKIVGGIGSCGQELCCSTFLPSFAPVTIRMAKNQNLALNPARVSGQCGRLKCCLVYEEAQYIEAGKLLPRLGKRVETPDGVGRVDDLDVLGGRVRVSFPDKPAATYNGADLKPAAPLESESPGARGDGGPGTSVVAPTPSGPPPASDTSLPPKK
ncbi:MAG TPA: regulatory iron-sulfur-containing complex subunit RicT [Polyangia bacterium]